MRYFYASGKLGRILMVEKIVFVLILIIAVGGGVLGCIYEFGGRKVTPEERADSGKKEGEEA